MNDWKKVPAELVTRFDAALPQAADVQRRQMFGCPCAFVNGNMFAGLHEDRLMIRLPEEAAALPAVIMGKTMKEYALLTDAVGLSANAMAGWIERGYRYARALPPKAARAAKAAKPARPPAPKKAASATRAMKLVGAKVTKKAAGRSKA
jgi:TfoX/Sxy family transcriptional regulator of competence genes